MKWPNFLKFKKPQWSCGIRVPSFLTPALSFYGVWKRFIRQIPADARPIIKSYQHFIVLGAEKAGKSELIQGVVDQSQDLYPFDTSLVEIPEVQFYIGPRQIIEEVSYSTLENRSIKSRRQLIRLWKKLYAKNPPVVLVTYDCTSSSSENLKEQNKLAQLIAGKLSLLTGITKKQIQLRIALTNLDKVPGYLEFVRFLKQQNLSFTIPLSANFESNMLSTHLKSFAQDQLPLILISTSPTNYGKILQFFREMPQIFPAVEEFLRALVSHISFKNGIELETLCLTSNQEGSTSFTVFQWNKIPPTTFFFRYPMLKHQIGASFVYLCVGALLMNAYLQSRNELTHLKRSIELVDLLQIPAFDDQIQTTYKLVDKSSTNPFLNFIFRPFCFHQLKQTKDHLAHRIRKHLIEPLFRKTILENRGEFKYLYFLGLVEATSENNLGKFIYKNAEKWSKIIGLDQNLIKTYILCVSKPLTNSCQIENKASPFLPLTSLNPWNSFLKKIKKITDQPIFVEQPLEDKEISKETEKLLAAISRLREDPLIFAIATLLDEAGFKENENIRTVHWVGENIDALENFLLFVMQTSIPSLDVKGMNLAQLFGKLKEIVLLLQSENELYNFVIQGHLFSFDSNQWSNHVIAHNIERIIQEYMTLNADSNGAIFFNNTFETPELSVSQFQDLYSVFKTQITIPGRYSRGDFERKVRSPAEKLVFFIDSLPINPEEKKRFSNFITREAIGYIKTYQTKYEKFFDSYDMETDSLKGVKKLLTELSKSTSPFYDFLRTIQQQTSVFSEPILSMTPPPELNEFGFLNTVLNHKDGKAPIEAYQQLIGQLLEELEKNTPNPSNSKFLTPIANLSLSILQRQPNSYLLQVQECLNQMGIPERFQSPFNKPVLLAYKLGLKELKQNIENWWGAQYEPKIKALLSKFPFNSKGEVVASITEVEEILHPHSKFTQELHILGSMFSFKKDDLWETIEENSVSLDPQIYEQLNHLSYLANLLWDNEGKAKALTLKISSIPFKTRTEHTIPTLVYIIAGEESIYNFNQGSLWQVLSIEWWKADSCHIGMELINKFTNIKSYRSLSGPSSPWSFFSLLKQADHKKENIWEWSVPGKNESNPNTISFSFEKNPYQIFQPGNHL